MSKDLEYEVNNFANLLHKDCMNLMECLKKQSEDNKPILYLGKHYEKVILPYEEYKKMCKRLEAIEKGKNTDIIDNYMAFKNDNAEPSEALEAVKQIEFYVGTIIGLKFVKGDNVFSEAKKQDYEIFERKCNIIKQALLKQQEHNSVNLLMQELDCKDFADLRKYARCGYEKLNNK